MTRGYIGVSIQDITDDLAQSLSLKVKKGTVVSDVVEGGPADKAGIKRGDVIIAFDNHEVKDSHELLRPWLPRRWTARPLCASSGTERR